MLLFNHQVFGNALHLAPLKVCLLIHNLQVKRCVAVAGLVQKVGPNAFLERRPDFACFLSLMQPLSFLACCSFQILQS
jgi:hypothetical protein